MNTKHADILKQMNIEKRKRGRPRKYVRIYFFILFFFLFFKFQLIDTSENNNYEKLKYNPFFQNEKRAKKQDSNEIINYDEVVKNVFEDLFKKHSNCFLKVINEPNENPILNYLLNKRDLDVKICDDIICTYLNYIAPFTNQKYFIFVTKFIILFRECVNVIQSKEPKYSEKEYTSIENAEIFPEQCNEFFSNFLEKYQFFDFSEDDKSELIEIIQYFCYWLFINNYTKSKLSLAS